MDDHPTGEVLPLGDPEPALLTTIQKAMYERMRTVLDVLRMGHSRQTAAGQAGVNHSTLRQWLIRGRKPEHANHPLYPWFHEQVLVVEGIAEGAYANVVLAAAKDNWKAAMFILQKRYHWSDRTREDELLSHQHKRAQFEKTVADTKQVKARTALMEREGLDESAQRIIAALSGIDHGNDGDETRIN